SSFRGNFGKRNPHDERDGYDPQLSQHQEDDGTVMMRDIQEYPQVRHTPYSTRRNKRRAKWHNEGHIHITVWRDRKLLKRQMGENTQDGNPGSWFKITVSIPYGGKYDKTWLVNSIQSHCSVPFTPVDFHYVKNHARFFVQDASIASALKDVSYKICDEENQKISIFVNPSNVPYSVRYKLKPKEMKELKLTMHKRYDVSHEALDLQSLRFDPDLVGHDIDIILNRRNCMAATLQIIEENFPELTLVWELNKMKGLMLEELWLDGNPLCDTFPDQSTYIRSNICMQEAATLVLWKDLRLSLLLPHRYYLMYDSGDHQGLLGAYHHEACFSLTIPFNPEDQAPSSLCGYFKESRNMKKLKDPCLWVQLLKHTKRDIMCSLGMLPKTQHDLSSFVVDMWFQTEMMLCFSVNGVFKEVEGRSQGSVRAFTRTFIVTPASNSSICIVNDELFVREATPSETQSAFSIRVPTPTSSSMPTLSQEQQEMVQAFSTQSGMKLEWSQK
uniref:NTF2 domain-containing protein n=1 Tax=Lynx canadensis TaxID=61383 RepID=A0A667IVS9_LYNCA